MGGGRKVWLDEGKNSYNIKKTIWYDAQVIDNNDPAGAMRIKVKAVGIDKNNAESSELIKASKWDEIAVNPLLPKFLTVVPKVNERVKIWVPDPRKPNINRFYIGPTIGQLQNFNFQDYLTANAGTQSSPTKLNASYKDNPKSSLEKNENWSVYPNTFGSSPDIALNSRGNSDIILRSKPTYDEVQLRVAKYDWKSPSNSYNINTKNPGYIIVAHYQPIKKSTLDNSLGLDKDRTHINLVADNLNLISHKGSSDEKSQRTPAVLSGDINEQLNVEHNSLHPVLYGDVFWDFLQLLGNYVVSHIHIGDRLSPDPSLATLELTNWIEKNSGKKITKRQIDENDIVLKVNTVEESSSFGVKTYEVIEGSTFLSKGVKTN